VLLTGRLLLQLECICTLLLLRTVGTSRSSSVLGAGAGILPLLVLPSRLVAAWLQDRGCALLLCCQGVSLWVIIISH
jgi:hypothetical protein